MIGSIVVHCTSTVCCAFRVTPSNFSTVCDQLKNRNAQISLLTGIMNSTSVSNNVLYYMATYGNQLSFSGSAVGNTWLSVPVVDATGESTWGTGSYSQSVILFTRLYIL